MTTNHDPSESQSAPVKITGLQEKRYFRSLDEFFENPEHREKVAMEFPSVASELLDPFSRRSFLKFMGASLALAGVTGCTPWQPTEHIMPYTKTPEDLIPGVPLFFATAFPFSGYGYGVLAESNMGRPTKVEGNPDHPASLGATDIFGQASVLDLYDPDRSQALLHIGRASSWDNFVGAMTEERAKHVANGGAGLRVLTEAITSPTMVAQLTELARQLPNMKWHVWEPVGRGSVHAGAQMAFGAPFDPVYHFDRADVVVSLDSNFLYEGPGRVRYARDFISRRKISGPDTPINRLYAFESAATITGAMADHKAPVKPSLVETIARAIAQGVGAAGAAAANLPPEVVTIVNAAVKDLQAARGRSIVVPGEHQSPTVHALAHAINEALGNVGATVALIPPVEGGIAGNNVDSFASLRELAADIEAGRVDTLVIVGANPVFSAPADIDFAALIQKPRLRVHTGSHVDETAQYCHWHVPMSHYLESWGDVRSFDGTASIIQPLIAPLYATRSPLELIAILAGRPGVSAYDLVREYWAAQGLGGASFERAWRDALNLGVVPNTSLVTQPAPQAATQAAGAAQSAPAVAAPAQPPVEGQAVAPAVARPAIGAPRVNAAALAQQPAAGQTGGIEVVFRPDPNIWDGRYANNGWLQELPRPFSKTCWDAVVYMNPAEGMRDGYANGDVVEITVDGGRGALRAPVFLQPGTPAGTVTVFLGYGRTRAGKVASAVTDGALDAQVDSNANLIRRSDAPWFMAGASLRKTGEIYRVVNTQEHFNMEGRKIVQAFTLAQYRQDPKGLLANAGPLPETPGEISPQHGLPASAGAPAQGTPEGPTAAKHAETATEQAEHHTFYEPWPYNDNKWGMAIDAQSCIGCNACVVACVAENNIAVVGKEQVGMGREMHWLRIDTYYSAPEGQDIPENPETYFQPIPCMHCENAPCEVVCPVNATVHSAEGLNDMVYNRCIGTRYCSNNCPYKVRRFNFFQYSDVSPLGLLNKNPDVTVRTRGVMEKCTYCVQRIVAARTQAEVEDRPVRDGEVQTACQQVCPTQAIVFGNMNDPQAQVTRLKQSPLHYGVLAELNTRPRTTFLARITNPNPDIRG